MAPLHISRTTLNSERHRNSLDLEAGNVICAVKRLRGYLCSTKFHTSSDHKALEHMDQLGESTRLAGRAGLNSTPCTMTP